MEEREHCTGWHKRKDIKETWVGQTLLVEYEKERREPKRATCVVRTTKQGTLSKLAWCKGSSRYITLKREREHFDVMWLFRCRVMNKIWDETGLGMLRGWFLRQYMSQLWFGFSGGTAETALLLPYGAPAVEGWQAICQPSALMSRFHSLVRHWFHSEPQFPLFYFCVLELPATIVWNLISNQLLLVCINLWIARTARKWIVLFIEWS